MDDRQALREAAMVPRTGLMTVSAPFTRDQVWSLNAYQDDTDGHPYTCPNPHPPKFRRLIATSLGWVCRDRSCGYTQDWAHAYTTNWEWRSKLDEHSWNTLKYRRVPA